MANDLFNEGPGQSISPDSEFTIRDDPHGISSAQGTAYQNSHLINFDISIIILDSRTGRLEFNDLGEKKGCCFLFCRGEDHSPESCE